MDLDFLQVGAQTWDIVVDTNEGALKLLRGGKLLSVAGARRP
jgi:D-galactose 1-dehydrogenase